MNSDWLESFKVFAEHLNFTHAANALNISQPALHVKIKKLSESLGVPLYHKSGKEIALTQDGKRVESFAHEIHDRQEEFMSDFRGIDSERPLIMTAGEGSYLYLLGPAILDFQKRCKTPLRLLTGNSDVAIDNVLSGRSHIGIAATTAVPASLKSEVLTQVEQILVLPPGHRLAGRSNIRLKDLSGEQFILPPPNRPHRIAIERILANKGIPWEQSVEANGWELMLHLVRLGAGITIVNGCCKIPKNLVVKPLKELPRITYTMLQRIDAYELPSLKAFKGLLRKHSNDWESV